MVIDDILNDDIVLTVMVMHMIIMIITCMETLAKEETLVGMLD